MNIKEANEMVEKTAATLGEHFGSVIILASFPCEKDGHYSQMVRRGTGDWFAQQGMLREELQRTGNVDLSFEIELRRRETLERDKGDE